MSSGGPIRSNRSYATSSYGVRPVHGFEHLLAQPPLDEDLDPALGDLLAAPHLADRRTGVAPASGRKVPVPGDVKATRSYAPCRPPPASQSAARSRGASPSGTSTTSLSEAVTAVGCSGRESRSPNRSARASDTPGRARSAFVCAANSAHSAVSSRWTTRPFGVVAATLLVPRRYSDSVDATIARAHQHAAGARRESALTDSRHAGGTVELQEVGRRAC